MPPAAPILGSPGQEARGRCKPRVRQGRSLPRSEPLPAITTHRLCGRCALGRRTECRIGHPERSAKGGVLPFTAGAQASDAVSEADIRLTA